MHASPYLLFKAEDRRVTRSIQSGNQIEKVTTINGPDLNSSSISDGLSLLLPWEGEPIKIIELT